MTIKSWLLTLLIVTVESIKDSREGVYGLIVSVREDTSYQH